MYHTSKILNIFFFCQKKGLAVQSKERSVKIIASDISAAVLIMQYLAKKEKTPPRNVKFGAEEREMLQHWRRIQIQTL